MLKKDKLRYNEYYDMQSVYDELYQQSRNNNNFYKLIEIIGSKQNIRLAYKNLRGNSGSHTKGTDGLTIEDIGRCSDKEMIDTVRGMLSDYKPKAVRRVLIPKPGSDKKRPLGIPCIWDRLVQQCILQVLEPICEPKFHNHSYGFRPNRSCEMAVRQLLVYLNEGYEWIVDIDLEKFFDNVPQDRLMSLVHDIINDGDTESLIRKYLKAGVMTPQGYEETKLGTPQGGNLSPLLSNIMLNELDKELEARGLRFTRYADDCVIALKSESSAKRVMRTVSDWIQRKLGLKVNMNKTHITRPLKLKYLGFGFYKDSKTKEWKCRPHQDSVKKFKDRLKELTSRKMPGTVTSKIEKINQVTRGWINYYAIGSMKTAMTEIDAHLRTRLRVIIWKQWKVPKKRQWGLQKLGVGKDLARLTAYCGDRYYWVVTRTCVGRAISKEVLRKVGLISCLDYYKERHALKLY